MPISEDEIEDRTIQEPRITMSKADLRKTYKPIMEKRRRARINLCLNEIKSLILEALNKDPARHSKLEKADILEMAVKHLQSIQRQQLALAMATDQSVLRKFKNGFNDCADEIDKYLTQLSGLDDGMKTRVSNHLHKCIGGIEQVAHLNFPGLNNLSFLNNQNLMTHQQNKVDSTIGKIENRDDQNNNPPLQISQGIQLIPSRLPTGELALLVPNSSNLSCFANFSNDLQQAQREPQRNSAFATVIPSSMISKPLSPPLSPDPHNQALELRYECNRSPQGFRPVYPTNSKNAIQHHSQTISSIKDEPQNAHISSTSVSIERPTSEVKSIKFPIHNYQEKRSLFPSPKKLVEPLCFITNQNERFKQAQVRHDSASCEENVPRGIKRKFSEVHQGLLTLVQESVPSKKVFKMHSSTVVVHHPMNVLNLSNIYGSADYDDRDGPSTSRDRNNADSVDLPGEMWRPW